MGQATRHIAKAKRLIPGKTEELSVIIPAAGIGRRMRLKDAKCLLEIEDSVSIIEKQLENILSVYPKADIILVVGYQAKEIRNKLKNYHIRMVYNPMFEQTNVAFSINLGLYAAISDKCLLVYGDLLFNKYSIANITDGNSKLLIDYNNDLDVDEVGLIIDENYNISNLSFGLPKRWGQIAYIKDRELDILKQVCYNENTHRWFGYELLNEVINNGGKFDGYIVPNCILTEIDTYQDLQKAKLKKYE
jgi:choline kinase